MHNMHLSMTPGAIIGYRQNGTPIRLIAGGGEPTPLMRRTSCAAHARRHGGLSLDERRELAELRRDA